MEQKLELTEKELRESKERLSEKAKELKDSKKEISELKKLVTTLNNKLRVIEEDHSKEIEQLKERHERAMEDTKAGGGS